MDQTESKATGTRVLRYVICIILCFLSIIPFYILLINSTLKSGDILTGIIAGLCAQHMPLPEAARLGVYLHGCAGDTAAFNKGFHSMTASDVLDAIPELLKEITLD